MEKLGGQKAADATAVLGNVALQGQRGSRSVDKGLVLNAWLSPAV